MSEVLEQYFPGGVGADDHAMVQDIAMTLSMCGGPAKKAEQNNDFVDIRTIGCFVFYVFNFDSEEERKLPFTPRKTICGVSESGAFKFKDGKFEGNMAGMGYAFSFEDRGGVK